MLENAQDLFLIIGAASVLLFTLFVCWALYYVIGMLRDMSKITLGIREKMEIVDRILKLVKEKLEKGSNHMAMLADSAIKLVGYFIDQGTARSAKKKKLR